MRFNPVSSLTLIVPVFNEINRVLPLLGSIDRVAWPDGLKDLEILVVDDGSTDGSKEVLEQWCRDHPTFSLLAISSNQGKGAAIRHGLPCCRPWTRRGP
jgi:glycosyltransferase involved in cell wall biosynthesis